MCARVPLGVESEACGASVELPRVHGEGLVDGKHEVKFAVAPRPDQVLRDRRAPTDRAVSGELALAHHNGPCLPVVEHRRGFGCAAAALENLHAVVRVNIPHAD
eukprot:scaffold7544_cov107-Isochrysis_galbana.AAC.16